MIGGEGRGGEGRNERILNKGAKILLILTSPELGGVCDTD